MYTKTRVATALLLVTVALAIGGCQVAPPPQARAGVLDLSAWDFAGAGAVPLDGEWEFYWQQQLGPGDFDAAGSGAGPGPAAAAADPPALVSVPGAWNGARVAGQALPGVGYATYRLRVHLPPTAAVMGIYVHYMSTAYRLWVDGALLAANGVVGADAQATVPQFLPTVAYFRPQSQTVTVVAQVANFDHRVGGIWNRIYLDTGTRLSNRTANKLAFAQFLTGATLVMALYHFGLFALRRNEPSTLYFGLFCLIIAIRLLVSGEFFLIRLLPAFPWAAHLKIEYLTGYLALPVFYRFVRSLYPDEVAPWSVRLAQAVGGPLALVTLAVPAYTASLMVIPYQVVLVLFVLYIGYALVRAALRRRGGSGHFLVGGGCFLATVVHDLLSYNQLLVTSRLIPAGLFVLILAESVVLAKGFAAAFHRQQALTRENAGLLHDLQQHLAEIRRSRRLLTAREENLRKSIAELLHGSVQTKLLVADHHLAAAAEAVQADPRAAALLAAGRQAIQQVREEDVRRASHLLHPSIIQIGLVAAARQLIDRFADCFAADLAVDPQLAAMDDPARGAVPEPVRLAVYRVLEEALGNVQSHAAATHVRVSLGVTPAGALELQVQDDGKGLDPAALQPGLGLRSIAARVEEMGGAWRIRSAPGQGTTLSASFPLHEGEISRGDSPADTSAPA